MGSLIRYEAYYCQTNFIILYYTHICLYIQSANLAVAWKVLSLCREPAYSIANQLIYCRNFTALISTFLLMSYFVCKSYSDFPICMRSCFRIDALIRDN